MSYLYEYKSIWEKKASALFMERFIKRTIRKIVHSATGIHVFIHSFVVRTDTKPNQTKQKKTKTKKKKKGKIEEFRPN